LERAGIEVETYYASEIDKHAIAISKKNYPDIVQLGSVVGLVPPEEIDLLIGGSPCQDLSIAKRERKGLDGDRSGLFWEYVRIRDECKPTYFILENVASMAKKDRDIITTTLGVQPVLFNASLVSAQCRKRLFWTNLKFDLPEDKGILLKDILQPDANERIYNNSLFHKTPQTDRNETKKLGYVGENDHQAKRVYDDNGKLPALNVVCNSMVKMGHIGNNDAQANRVYNPSGKSCTLSANGGGLGAKTGLYQANDIIRKLTPIECERLQCLPDNYTEGIAKTNRYKCLGNAFNVDVVSHILSSIDNGRD
jgi:DNA (cytosine-5)-methyltransferase 3A